METSDSGRLVASGGDIAAPGELLAGWRLGRRQCRTNDDTNKTKKKKKQQQQQSKKKKIPCADSLLDSGEDEAGGDQEQAGGRQQRECSRPRDNNNNNHNNNNEAPAGRMGEISIGERLRFSLLGKRGATDATRNAASQHQQLSPLSWRGQLASQPATPRAAAAEAVAPSEASSSGHAKRQADAGGAIVTVPGEPAGQCWPLHNNGSASELESARTGGHREGGRDEWDSLAAKPNSKIFHQYLPTSRSFNLNDHTPREGNNKFACADSWSSLKPSASASDSTAAPTAAPASASAKSQTEAGGEGVANNDSARFHLVQPDWRAVEGERGAGEQKRSVEAAQAAQVDDDEKINFARTKQKQKNKKQQQRRQQKLDEHWQWPVGSNNEQEPPPNASGQLDQRAGPDLSGELSVGKRAQDNNERQPTSSSSSSLVKSIASAWSRLRISPSGARKQSNQHFLASTSSGSHNSSPSSKSDALLLNNNYDQADHSERRRNQLTSTGGERSLAEQSVLELRRRELEVLKRRQEQLERARVASTLAQSSSAPLVKRKGFLHAKGAGTVVSVERVESALAAQLRARARNASGSNNSTNNNNSSSSSKLVRPKVLSIDLNNNISSSAASLANNFNQRLSNYASQLSRRGTRESNCLLEEEEEEEEQQEQQVFVEKVEDLAGPKMWTKSAISEESVTKGPSKMQDKLATRACMSAKRKQESKPMRGSGGGESSLLVAATTAIWLFLVLAGAQFALGQQPPAPFTRSQRPAGSAVGAGPPPPPPPHAMASPNMGPPMQRAGAGGVGNAGVGPPPLVAPATGSLVANISCNKIRGHVTLTPNLEGGTTVTTQISAGPPGEVYQWSIHQFPIKPGAAMCSCSSLILGSKLVDLSEMHGNLPSDQEFSVQSSLQLFDFDSPLGHSLLLRGLKTGMLACGTFLPTNRKSNYRAKFHTPLSGSITIFQTSFGTSLLSHLMYSNGTRRHSTHRFDLVRSDDDLITSSLLTGGQQAANNANGNAPGRSNLDQLEQREHENELQACRRFSTGEPLFKNLTYQLSVSTENFGMRGRTALVLPQIPFETFSSVYVVVYSEYDSNEPIACAPLRFVKPKTAAAKFQTNSVQGNIVFSQDSPYDVTLARVSLNFPNSDGHSYGIDELPMIIRRKSDTRVCPNIREIIYNPHHIEPSSVPAEGEATSDQYAVGDLSGKYGSLTGKASERITAADHNLPLFGPVSIIGRALTIYSADGVAIACSNVELTTPMTTAFATFDYGIQGQFIFRQPMNDCNGDTYVYIEVSKPSAPSAGAQADKQQQAVASLASGGGHHDHSSHMQTRSLDHNWHIHVNPVDSGLEHLSTTECSLAGPHYNPYNTSTTTIYSRDCTPFNVLRCELGDLSSKMFTIEIPPYKVKSGGQEPDIGKFFGTDIELPLCGPTSIVNRSVVVHVADFGAQRLACSTVIEFKPRT